MLNESTERAQDILHGRVHMEVMPPAAQGQRHPGQAVGGNAGTALGNQHQIRDARLVGGALRLQHDPQRQSSRQSTRAGNQQALVDFALRRLAANSRARKVSWITGLVVFAWIAYLATRMPRTTQSA